MHVDAETSLASSPFVTSKPRLVIVGNGMVGHRLVDEMARSGALMQWTVVVIGEEPRPAYDRVALSSFFDGASAEDLAIGTVEWYAERDITLALNDEVTSIDRAGSTVRTSSGATYTYDHLVLATGSYPFVPPIDGRFLSGCFVYRTIEDLEAIRTHAQLPGVRIGAVIGGGLLGLEAANALRLLDLETHVLEFAPRLMPLQLCDGGGNALRSRIEALDVTVHVGAAASACIARDDNPSLVAGLQLGDGSIVDADLVVFSAGVRPRDQLARDCGLIVGERGGISVDEYCETSDPSISAIGECALAAGRVWGLVGPGYDMARVVADRLSVDTETVERKMRSFTGGDLSTKLKLLGIDVASFGDAHGTTSNEPVREVVWADAATNVYRRVVLSADGTRVLGGVLVGDASGAAELTAMAKGLMAAPADVRLLVLPSDAAAGAPTATGSIDPTTLICSCNNVTAGAICATIVADQLSELGAVKRVTSAGTGCGGCVPLVKRLLDEELRKAGQEVNERLCEHFAFSRVQLFDIVRALDTVSFTSLIESHGQGLGCEICKPAVASMLASLGNGYILDGEQAALQDTNDHFLANMQKDGTYSVVPRVPGGEITPAQLIAIGRVAEEFSLYTKITGGQRIDLFGARVEQLPAIWKQLIDAGMESGHAYGKALRTVKSCVGQTWCRYGVQDSTSLAIDLELRYRGLRAPHKLKMAVSGCVRECAEAQGKDVGVIATERGWNLWVGGNGGMRPRHADLLAEDLDTETLIRTIDRFFAFYIRTADRLERTSTWIEKRPGGIAELRRILIEDELGIGAELEAMIEHHVATYECEWKATLDSPARLDRFRSFVNTDEVDPTIVMEQERGQIRPATVPTLVSIGSRR
jgi:nitrite reductase (NADH) large subunit